MNIKPETGLIKQIPIGYARKYEALPCTHNGNMILVVSSETPQEIIDEMMRLTGIGKYETRPSKEVLQLIDEAYEMASDDDDYLAANGIDGDIFELKSRIEESPDLLDSQGEAPIIKFANSMFFRAIRLKASDIHLEPYEKEFVVRNRIDGVLHNVVNLPRGLHAPVISRIKVMAGLDIAEKRLPQDGRIKVRLGGRDIDIRVSIVPTSFGERAVLRILDRSSILMGMKDLGMAKRQLSLFSKYLKSTTGILLVTGPTGSGKTTTLYAALRSLDSDTKNIITIEDPVEYQMKGIGQIQVNPKINLTFAGGLRSILRQDPDIIMVGEIRDGETAEISIQASLTGHLVLSTLHTNDAPSAVTRLMDMGVEPFLISSSVECVVAQRLIRKLCPHCKVKYEPSKAELELIGKKYKIPALFKASGCGECYKTGYSGRTGIYEIMPVTEKLHRLITEKADADTIRTEAESSGMATIREHGIFKAYAGITSLEEVLRVTAEQED
jgi:general secretion pathway protein E